ncbi:MAG: hypothetical protein EPN60_10690 [Nevskiaceae bacterium]|nr:MAG: hypothetical protein EPO48_15650 [Nevskiaceae bacterium]TAM26213.1 MAG: hypothetical protein EPN60_10690 [Nevskiaceae bacterium]
MSTDWPSFKELDEAASLPKGEAFRAFRRLERFWLQDRDYRLLQAYADAAEIAELKHSGRVYRGSANVVLLAPARAEELLAILRNTALTQTPAGAQAQQ